jgi:hypothetical protein
MEELEEENVLINAAEHWREWKGTASEGLGATYGEIG